MSEWCKTLPCSINAASVESLTSITSSVAPNCHSNFLPSRASLPNRGTRYPLIVISRHKPPRNHAMGDANSSRHAFWRPCLRPLGPHYGSPQPLGPTMGPGGVSSFGASPSRPFTTIHPTTATKQMLDIGEYHLSDQIRVGAWGNRVSTKTDGLLSLQVEQSRKALAVGRITKRWLPPCSLRLPCRASTTTPPLSP